MEVLDMLAPAATEARPGYKLTTLGWLPAGWEVVRVNDVARMGSGHTPDKKKDAYYNGGIKWVSLQDSHRLDKRYVYETTLEISEAGLRNSSAVLHPANTVVLCRDAGVGKCAIIAEDMAVSQHFIAWRCGPQLHPEFLYYTLLSRREYFEQHANGSTIKTLGLPFFQKLQIALPPLPEQQRIVAVLAAIDETLTAYDNLLHAKRRYQQGLMQQLLTGQRRFPEFARQAWREVSFGEVFRKKGAKNTDNAVQLVITVGKYAIRPQNAHFNRSVASADLTNYNVIEPGDFVYDPMSAYYGAIGRYDLDEPGIVSPVYRVLQASDAFDSDFIKHLLKSHHIQSRLDSSSTQGNKEGKRRGLQDSAFNLISFMCPSLPEQRRIAAVLTALAIELHLLATQRAHWQQQKQGLLQALLTGVVRVNTTI